MTVQTSVQVKKKTVLSTKKPRKTVKKVSRQGLKASSSAEEKLQKDLPSSSVRTIRIPGIRLLPVEDSGIFKWKRINYKVGQSLKHLRRKVARRRKEKRRKSARKIGREETSSDEEDKPVKVESTQSIPHLHNSNQSLVQIQNQPSGASSLVPLSIGKKMKFFKDDFRKKPLTHKVDSPIAAVDKATKPSPPQPNHHLQNQTILDVEHSSSSNSSASFCENFDSSKSVS